MLTAIRFSMLALSMIVVWTIVPAQPPPESPNPPGLAPTFKIPDNVPLPPEASPEAKERIRRALSGEDGETMTGDPTLDDVLQIIKRRGSILDGSTLADRESSHPDKNMKTTTERARVAESLLRSARLLERLPDGGADRADLINSMRSEAANVLMQP